MAKGKAKNNSSGKADSLAPPKPRSLRSRKRESPGDEISETVGVQASLHQQDTERNNTVHTVVDAALLQHHQPSQDEHQAEEQSCHTKQDPATEEKHAQTTTVSWKNVMVKAVEAQEETTVTKPSDDSQLEGCRVPTDGYDANQSGKDKEEITTGKCNSSASQICTDDLQVVSPTPEEDEGSCANALEEQMVVKENPQCNLERNQETSHEEHISVADVREVTKEALAGLPAQKKRRMGVCGLTEKERSYFLQTQKRENGQNGPGRAEKQIWSVTADLGAQGEVISAPPLPISPSVPAGSVTEQNEAETKRQSSHCGGGDRPQTEVHVAVTTSEGTSTVSDPGCSEGQSCQANGGAAPPAPGQTDTKSEPPPEEEILGKQEQQEFEGCAAETMAEKPQEQMKDAEDGLAVVDQSPAIRFYCSPMQNEETENQDAIEAAPLQVNNVTRTGEGKKEELNHDGDRAEASSAGSQSGRFSYVSVELSEAAVSPSGSERKDSSDPDDEPGAGPSLNAVPAQPRDTADPFESGHLDYVSDSQLNTIALIEEEAMEGEEDLGSPDCHDATDLICGLIRELSSLNRKVMATHRELENLRRSTKGSRSSIR